MILLSYDGTQYICPYINFKCELANGNIITASPYLTSQYTCKYPLILDFEYACLGNLTLVLGTNNKFQCGCDGSYVDLFANIYQPLCTTICPADRKIDASGTFCIFSDSDDSSAITNPFGYTTIPPSCITGNKCAITFVPNATTYKNNGRACDLSKGCFKLNVGSSQLECIDFDVTLS